MDYSRVLIIVIACTFAHETYAVFCASEPCQNGGTCYTGNSSYLCVCPGKYSGQNCQIYQDYSDYSVNPCSANTCFNAGTCFTGPQGAYYCLCASGFQGTRCEVSADTDVATTAVPSITSCTSSTCKNEGTCFTSSTLDGIFCYCPSGYVGAYCETVTSTVTPYAIIYCNSDPCTNGGTCYTGQSGYICMCPAGFTGHQCQIRAVCSSEQPCLNGGSCELRQTDEGLNVTLCTCPEFYQGNYCDTLVSCIDVPCKNGGTCIPVGENAMEMICSCTENFYGVHCQEEVDICSSSSPCKNGGTCFTSSDDRSTFVCSCVHGFEGQLCERSNPCVDNPCENGGVCFRPLDPASDRIMCQCLNGFVGFRCEIVDTGVGACVNDACMNGGSCVPSPFADGGLTCTCPDSYTGDRCQHQIPLACESNPCLHGATCDNTDDGDYWCTCLEGYAGRRCQVIGPCASAPCMNDGICVEDAYNPGNFLCQCRNQYTGPTCTIPPQEDPCNSNPCQNGGECVPTSSGTSYYCDCPVDFVGLNCDVSDPCSPSPCQNSGVCNTIPLVGGSWGFLCICTGQYLGLTCSVQRACVSNPCQNGGQCTDIPGSASQPIYGTELTSEMLYYDCHCLAGWTGQNCETTIVDPCQSNPCQNNGTCFRSHLASSFFCSCPGGFYGSFCVADPCAANPCKNNGTCQSTGNQYSCTCRTGYSGANCTMEDLCHNNPCKNRGTCTQTATSFECSCAEGFVGTDCSQPDPCFAEPCLNGGNCISVRRGSSNTIDYQCLCLIGYGGLTCGVQFGDPIGATPVPNNCLSQPCQNDGSCYQSSSSSGQSVCICPDSFTGTQCETPIPTSMGTSAPMTPEPDEPMTSAVPSGCDYGPRTYMDGDSWQDGCKNCTCTGTQYSCSSEGCKCTSGDQTFNNGESWIVGCHFCSCLSGRSSCSDMACRDRCLHESKIYEPGSIRTDNCNTCECKAGAWQCTNNDCGQTCTYINAVYLSNEARRDNCNTCYCLEGEWSCTTKDCDTEPIVIKVEFDFSSAFTDVAGKEGQFIEALTQDLNLLLGLKGNHIQNVTISAGSIKVKFNLVENKTDNINIETVAVILEMAITKNDYSFMFEGKLFQSVPDSFKMEQQDALLVPSDSPDTLIIIIAVVACGVVGILIITGSVCLFVRRHSTRRELTTYGDERLQRRSGNTSDDWIVNEGL